MINVIKNLINAAHHFTAIDFAVFKICLLSVGILLGTYFSIFFQNYITLICIVVVFTWLILIIRVYRYLGKLNN